MALLIVASALGVQPAGAQATKPRPEGACDYNSNYDASFNDNGIGYTSDLTGRPGRYALPSASAEPPTALVAMFHGYGNDSCSWRRHLQRVASTGAIAFAMDYEPYAGAPSNHSRRGWSVKQGALDAIAQAQYFLERYPSIRMVISFGISMGGNAAGLAVAQPVTRKDGSPLFDYWINVEGVNNLTEEYQALSPLGPVNAAAEEFRIDVERETGGPLYAVPAAFQERTVVARAPDIAATKLKGALLVQGVDDGLVPHNQLHEMTAALRAVNVPVEAYTVLRSATAEDYPDTTASAIALGALMPGYNSTLAGHGWEGSNTQVVVKTGFDELFAILCGRRTSVAAFDEHTVDGDVASPPICAAKVLAASASGSAGSAQAAAAKAAAARAANGAPGSLPATGGRPAVAPVGALGLALAMVVRSMRRRRSQRA